MLSSSFEKKRMIGKWLLALRVKPNFHERKRDDHEMDINYDVCDADRNENDHVTGLHDDDDNTTSDVGGQM